VKNASARRSAICLKDKDCEALVVRKVCPVRPDENGEKEEHLRVSDESGEDYLHPASHFFVTELPQEAKRALRQMLSVAL